MKYFAVFFFCLLVHTEGSSSHKYTHNRKVDVDLIAEDYVYIASKLPVPVIEYGDNSSKEFKDSFTKDMKIYSENIVSYLYDEAKYAGEQLIDDIKRDMDRFRNALKSVRHTHKSNCLEKALKRINDQLYVFLELKPEDLEYHSPNLPPLPKIEIKLESRTERRTAKEIFSNFVATTNSLALQVFAYLNSIFLNGVSFARKDFETVRIQIYEEILNGRVMRAYRQAVDEVCDHSHLVQHNVSPETWESFRSQADHIIAISHHKRHGVKDDRN